MKHFGVELHAPHFLAFDLISGNGNLIGRSDSLEIIGNGRNGIAVRHPHLRIFPHILE